MPRELGLERRETVQHIPTGSAKLSERKGLVVREEQSAAASGLPVVLQGTAGQLRCVG